MGSCARTHILLAVAALGLGCAARAPLAASAPTGDEVALYRDRAVIVQRVAVVAASAGRTIVPLRVAGDIAPGDVVVLELDGLASAQVRPVPGSAPPPPPTPVIDDVDLSDPDPPVLPMPVGPIARPDDPLDPEVQIEEEARAVAAEAAHALDDKAIVEPTPARALELVVDARRAGRFVIALAYVTQRVRWDAAYTVTTGPAHDRAVVRGTLTIHNTGGAALAGPAVVIDAALGAWRDRRADRLRAALRPAAARALGPLAIADGETRVELIAGDRPRALRSVLVYDPIGPALDHAGGAPASDPELGARTHLTTHIAESVELARDALDRGLPGGAGKLVERRADGRLVVLGAARLFDAATRVARVETIAIGTARGLVGHRERRDWAKIDDQRRFSEEFLLTIDSARAQPVEVVIREHLYRGQNWTLAYQSAPAVKEGAQQIALRAAVPANGQAKVLYVVVYTW